MDRELVIQNLNTNDPTVITLFLYDQYKTRYKTNIKWVEFRLLLQKWLDLNNIMVIPTLCKRYKINILYSKQGSVIKYL